MMPGMDGPTLWRELCRLKPEPRPGFVLVTGDSLRLDRVAQIRETGKPYAVEALTYRLVPHGAGDFFEKYRTKEEVAEWRTRDPIGILENRILDDKAADETALEALREEARQAVDDALQFADESPEPSLDELRTDVYAE